MFLDAPHASETTFSEDLTRPSLRGLSYILRHRELWPAGFKWDYRRFSACALGLACAFWQLPMPRAFFKTPWLTETFDIPEQVARNIFIGGAFKFLTYILGRVTPEMVAAQIDSYLA